MSSIIYDFKAIASRLPNGRRFGSADDETVEVEAGETDTSEGRVPLLAGVWNCAEHKATGWSASGEGCMFCAMKDQE